MAKLSKTTDTHVLDANGKKLGRVATAAAIFLMGKNDPKFQRHILSGDKVEIINASKLSITQQKLEQKNYVRYTGYPGGLRNETALKVVEKKGYGEMVRRAIYGMLPSNTLRAKRMKNLVIKE